MLLGVLLAVPASAGFARQDLAPEEEGCTVELGIHGLPLARCAHCIDRNATLPVWNTSLDFVFGRLSEGQLDKLLHTYSSWWGGEHDVAYDASRQYRLSDLLPPPVQALQGFVFVAKEKPRPSGPEFPYPLDEVYHTYKNSFLVPNCWTTLCEILRFAAARRAGGRPPIAGAPYFVFSTGDQPIIAWLDSATEHVGGPTDSSGLPRARQPGDVILVWIDEPKRTRKRLAHSLLLVDPNVVFEKAGTGDTTPFRLIDLDTIHQAWDPLLFKYEVRRPLLGAETAEQPARRFSIAAEAPAAWAEFWRWPLDVQRRFALGVYDNDDGSVACITLLEIEEHALRFDGRRWELAPSLPCDEAAAAGLAASGFARRSPPPARGSGIGPAWTILV